MEVTPAGVRGDAYPAAASRATRRARRARVPTEQSVDAQFPARLSTVAPAKATPEGVDKQGLRANAAFPCAEHDLRAPGDDRSDGPPTSSRPRPPWNHDGRVVAGRFLRAPRSEGDVDERRSVNLAIAWAKQGDPEAFRFLYACYADRVYRRVAGIVRDEREAEDITQNVFVKLMTKVGQYEERDCPFLAWLLRVARNTAVDHVRGLRLVPCAEVFGADSQADDHPGDLARVLRDALSTLPTNQREVLLLRHLAGMTPGEIAEILERSEPSIHGLHNRGRAALRRALEASESAPMVASRA